MNQWETGGGKKQAPALRKKAWEWQRTALSQAFCWLTPSGTYLETQLDPKTLIHQTDEYKGSNSEESGADAAFLSAVESLFKPGYVKLDKSHFKSSSFLGL